VTSPAFRKRHHSGARVASRQHGWPICEFVGCDKRQCRHTLGDTLSRIAKLQPTFSHSARTWAIQNQIIPRFVWSCHVCYMNDESLCLAQRVSDFFHVLAIVRIAPTIPSIPCRAVAGDCSVAVPNAPATAAPMNKTRAISLPCSPRNAAQNKPAARIAL